MVIRILIILFILTGGSLSAKADDATDQMIMEVYAQYYSSIVAAELCDEIPFANDEEKAKFEYNFIQVRINAAAVLKRKKPELTTEQIIENVKAMDNHMEQSLKQFYSEQGCANEVLTDALKWHNNFAKMPPFPEEKAATNSTTQ